MKAILVTTASLALSCAVLGNAYYQKKQFYPSVVYITKSNPSMAVLYIQAFVFVVLMGKLLRKVFFGQLRAAEMEHLIERSWYAVTETCLAFTVFRDDFSPRFVVLFTLLLFLKCFHWLGEDRVDYMERSPIISWVFHLRIISLSAVLGLVDAYFINHAYYSTILKGASVQLVFGFEYAILFTVVVTILLKYLLHSVDLQSENPWENKAVYMLYSELVLGFIRTGLYMSFMIIMIKVHTFPLFAIRPMYLTMRSFKKALNDVILSRRAIRNMNTLYPDATQEELETGDNVCIICREEMAPPGCKKLPCNHIFHTSCLRSWFQRQQTCPTCRMDVLRGVPPTRPTPPQQPAPPPQPQMPNFAVPGMFPGFPNQFPGWPPAGFPQVPPQQPPGQTTSTTASTTTSPTQASSTSAPTSTTTATGTTATPGTSAGIPGAVPGGIPPPFPPNGMPPFMPSPFMSPPFMFPPPMMGMMPPVPPMPTPDFAGLTDEEVRALEGEERRQVEARVKCLKNIQVLLDAAMVQIQQYTNVVTAQGMPGISVSGTESFTSSASTKEDLNLPKPGTDSIKTEERPSFDLGENDTSAPLEGAVGYTPPEEVRAAINNLQAEEEDDDEKNEIRRRRLQRFSQSESSST